MEASAMDPTAANISIPSSAPLDGNATVDEYTQQVIQRFQYVNLVVRIAMGVAAFSTNLLTIVAIASFESLRSATNYLIAFLAFADMVAGINSILLVTNYLAPFSDSVWTRMCALETTLHFISAGFNIRAIQGISIDRVVYITFPLRYYTWPTERAALIFIAAMLVTVPIHMSFLHCCGYNYLPQRVCTSKVFRSINYNSYTFIVDSAIIMMLNIRIAYIAYQQKKATAHGQVSEVSMQQNKITKMLAMVLGVYYLCYLPQISVLLTLGFLFPGATYGVVIERISSWFWWVNSWSNPPIYAWKNKEFNKAFRSLLGLKSATVGPALD